jgi:hypothetical protein
MKKYNEIIKFWFYLFSGELIGYIIAYSLNFEEFSKKWKIFYLIFFLIYTLPCLFLILRNFLHNIEYIEDLEDRCKQSNFAPYDDRFPVEDYSNFIWNEHTIKIAEDWLNKLENANQKNK